MRVLGLDFETTFTQPVDGKLCRIVEAGAVLWDVPRKTPLKIYSQISLWLPEYGPFDPQVTELTGITEADCAEFGKHPSLIIADLIELMGSAQAVVAHNGLAFDKEVFKAEAFRHNVSPALVRLRDDGKIPGVWLDTMHDVPYPKKCKFRNLMYIAAAHGFLNPFAHRACFDVLTMLTAIKDYDYPEMVRRAVAPKVTLRAVTQAPWTDGGKSNTLAKGLGFHYSAENGKIWIKPALAEDAQAEIDQAKKVGLEVVVIS